VEVAIGYGEREKTMTTDMQFKTGDLVTVTPQYVGGGNYRNDEWTGGPFTVVKVLKPWDYKLARGTDVRPYDVIVHECRVVAFTT
jgi:hypothetical protein